MSKIHDVMVQLDTRDEIVMCLVEDVRETKQVATPGVIASLIRGAPPADVRRVLDRLVYLEVLDNLEGYRVTPLGVEFLLQRVDNWEPRRREQERRDREMLEATAS